MDPVTMAAGITALASLASGLFGQKAAKKQRKEDRLQEGVDKAFSLQSQAAQNLGQGQQNSFAQLMQGYQNILR
jgi:hypothetical protein